MAPGSPVPLFAGEFSKILAIFFYYFRVPRQFLGVPPRRLSEGPFGCVGEGEFGW